MTMSDIVLQALSMASNPLVIAVGVILTFRLSHAWQIRLGTGGLAGAMGVVEGVVLGSASTVIVYGAVSAAAGLLVAEVALHVIPPVVLFVLRIAATMNRWYRRWFL